MPSDVTVKAWSHYTPPFPSTLAQIDVTPPLAHELGPTEILVSLAAASLNPVDVQLVNLPIFKLPALKAHRGLGKDFSGKVLAKGSKLRDDDTSFAVGDDIMGVTFNPLGGPLTGTLTRVAVFDTTRSCIIKRPSNLSPSEAASLPLVFLTAVTTLSPPYFHLPLSHSTSTSTESKRPTVVILGGSSGVGIYAIQYAVLSLSLNVITTCSPRNSSFVRSLGASQVIDYTSESVPDRLKELRPKEGYIGIIDCVGGTELFSSSSSSWETLLHPKDEDLKYGGSYVTIVGDKTSRDKMGGSLTNWFYPKQFWRIWRNYLFGWGHPYNCIMMDMNKDWLEKIEELVKDKGMKVVIDEEFGFEEVPKAFDKLNTGRARGKIVVNMNTSE